MKQAVVAFIAQDGKVCAVQRRNNPHDWGLPGGKKDPLDRTLGDAMIREVQEETGLVVVEYYVAMSNVSHGPTNHETTTFVVTEFRGEIWSPSQSLSLGEPGVAWVNPRALLYGSYGDYNMALFEHMLTS